LRAGACAVTTPRPDGLVLIIIVRYTDTSDHPSLTCAAGQHHRGASLALAFALTATVLAVVRSAVAPGIAARRGYA